jgi:NAD(P)-dependent dehydrogenase (short-subunit alcohol dehydrogenase family)
MRQFRRQGHGVLVQNGSIVGCTAKPDSTAYATSKFAVRGFSEALRMEVLDQPGIHVCTVVPSVTDTPFFGHVASFSYHKARPAGLRVPERGRTLVAGWRKRPNNGGVPLAATPTHGRLGGRNRPAGVRFCEPRPHPRQAGGERSDDVPQPAAGGWPDSRRP